jgi:beta-xylosidase
MVRLNNDDSVKLPTSEKVKLLVDLSEEEFMKDDRIVGTRTRSHRGLIYAIVITVVDPNIFLPAQFNNVTIEKEVRSLTELRDRKYSIEDKDTE